MSGAQAAVVAAGCCCQHQGGGGGGGGGGPPPPPVSCSDSSPGAVSDRATTAINVSAQFNVYELRRINWPEFPCRVETFGGNPICVAPPQQPFTGVLYRREGNGDGCQGDLCQCRESNPCRRCFGISWSSSGGSAILNQMQQGVRDWRLRQLASSLLPNGIVGEWSWRPGEVNTVPVGSGTIRGYCPPPVSGAIGTQPRMTLGGSIVQNGVISVSPDLNGNMVNTSTAAYTVGAFGNDDVGKCHVVMDARVYYASNGVPFFGTPAIPGWIASLSFAFVYRETHLHLRSHFATNSGWWTLEDFAPIGNSGFIVNARDGQAELSAGRPFYFWKPCVSGNDTVRGIYQPLSSSLYPSSREYFRPVSACCFLAGEIRGEAEMEGLIVS